MFMLIWIRHLGLYYENIVFCDVLLISPLDTDTIVVQVLL